MLHMALELVFWSAMAFILLAWSGNVPGVRDVICMRPYGPLLSSVMIGFIAVLISTKYNIVFLAGAVWMVNLYFRSHSVVNNIENPLIPQKHVEIALGICCLTGIVLLF